MKDYTIRTATKDDAARLLEIYAPYVENTAITFEYEVPSVAEFAQRIENTLKKYPYLIAESGDEILGYTYAGAFKGRAAYDWSVETTLYVKSTCHRQGIGKALYLALEKTLKAQNILNLNACIAYPEVEDEFLTQNSPHFHESMDYKLVGVFHQCGFKFHRWYDMIWMEKQIGEHTADPAAVIPFSEIGI